MNVIITILYYTKGVSSRRSGRINKGPAVCASYTVTYCRFDQSERSSETRLLCRMSTGSPEKSPDKQLLAACVSGDSGVVKRIVRDENLIERINTITDDYGMTPLHHACG